MRDSNRQVFAASIALAIGAFLWTLVASSDTKPGPSNTTGRQGEPIQQLFNRSLTGRPLAAAQFAEQMVQDRKSVTQDFRLRASAWQRAGIRDQADRAWAELLERVDADLVVYPDRPSLHYYRGMALHYLERPGEALVAWSDPSLVDAQWLARDYCLTVIDAQLGRTESAVQRLEQVLDGSSGASVAWIFFDPNLDPIRSDPRLLAPLERAARNDTQFIEAIRSDGSLTRTIRRQLSQGRWTLAAVTAGLTEQMHAPPNVELEATVFRAQILDRLGHTDMASSLWLRLHARLSVLPGSAEPASRAATSLAWSLAGIGDADGAKAIWARRADFIEQTDAPDNSGTQYNLACYRGLAGDLDAAVDHFVRAVELGYPDRRWAAVDFDLDPIRSDPRFIEALSTLSSTTRAPTPPTTTPTDGSRRPEQP